MCYAHTLHDSKLKLNISCSQSINFPNFRPYFDPAASEADCDAVLDETLAKFGHEGFRPGQREAIKRILR